MLLKQNHKPVFGALLAFLFLFSIFVPSHPQNGTASSLFGDGGEDSTVGDVEEGVTTSNIEVCDNLVDDDADGLVDNQDALDCPASPGLTPPPTQPTPPTSPEAEEEPTPTPEAEEQGAPDEEPTDEEPTDEEPTDEESQSAVEICDNTLDDDGDGLVDTEDTEDCPITEEQAAPEEEPTPTPEAEEQAAPEEEPTDEESQSAVEICDNTLDDDGDGLVDTEDTEDCPITEEEEPTPTPEAEEQARGRTIQKQNQQRKNLNLL